MEYSLDLNKWKLEVARPTPFIAGTNTRGDHDGTNASYTIFNVTGDVLVRIVAVCTVSLVGTSATLELGITGNTALLIAQTTATGIDATQVWNDTTPAIGDTLANITGPFVIPNGLDILEKTATASITAGQIHYNCLWQPISEDGKVQAAGNEGF